MTDKKRLLIFIVAYNAETTLESVLTRIPDSLSETYHIEVLVIDDASADSTFHVGREVAESKALSFPLHVLTNPINQGYGGNQKIGYRFAIEQNFDFVALVHGDGQYAPECLPDLMAPLAKGDCGVVLGSRMIGRFDALKGGMPVYKYIGNKILTWTQNKLLRSKLYEFHTGYRLYSVDLLRSIPFHLNSNDFHFDTQILIQCLLTGQHIEELAIPTYYGDEICHVNGMRYAKDVILTSIQARMQEYSLFYDPKYDCGPADGGLAQAKAKLGYLNPRTFAFEFADPGDRVLDLRYAGDGVTAALTNKNCTVTAVDAEPASDAANVERFIVHDLEAGPPKEVDEPFDLMLMVDALGHLSKPEEFLMALREQSASGPHVKMVASTGNVAFLITRLLHLVGMFNYGKRGILKISHKRLFTVGTFKRLFRQAGYEVLETHGMPVPIPEILGDNVLSRALMAINNGLIKLSKPLFACQIVLVVRPLPTLNYLLRAAHDESAERAQNGTTNDEDDRKAPQLRIAG